MPKTLKIILFVAFFFPLQSFHGKPKKKKNREKIKNNSSPLTTKWFTKLRALLQDQESMYLEKVKSKDNDQMKLHQWSPFQFGVDLTINKSSVPLINCPKMPLGQLLNLHLNGELCNL